METGKEEKQEILVAFESTGSHLHILERNIEEVNKWRRVEGKLRLMLILLVFLRVKQRCEKVKFDRTERRGNGKGWDILHFAFLVDGQTTYSRTVPIHIPYVTD